MSPFSVDPEISALSDVDKKVFLDDIGMTERGLDRTIRAEVIAFNDYVTLGGKAKSNEAGKMRLDGKDYIVKDGDVMHFQFNV